MTNRMILAALMGIMLCLPPSLVQSANQSMPPAFTPGASVAWTLRAYPLGVVTKQTALSHHGKPQRDIRLPNGLEGWVYDIGGRSKAPPAGPAGERKNLLGDVVGPHPHRVPAASPAVSYTLVFDNRSVVVDVLYNEKGPHNGLTALSVQHMKEAERVERPSGPAGAASEGSK